jgi:stalled ribosome alternative rescue factor ArfA|tara:strand:+ start:125 stop:313 length:189 start_codon:yes stop_codon:yes gene_type:complete
MRIVKPISPINPVAKHNRHRPQVVPAKKGKASYDRNKKHGDQHERNQNQESAPNGKDLDTYA